MYTISDQDMMLATAGEVKCLMEAVLDLHDAREVFDGDLFTMPITNQIMVKAYNTLHEYVMYREQRMREEENEEG